MYKAKGVPDGLETDSAISLVEAENNSQVTNASVSEEPIAGESNNDTEQQLVKSVEEEEKESVTELEQEKSAVEDNEIKTTNKKEEKPLVEQREEETNADNDNNNGDELSNVEVIAATATNEEKPTAQRTLAIIKPDAITADKKDDIIVKIKEAEFIIVQERQLHLSLDQARLFYREHEGKHFYDELAQWMSR